MIPSKRDTAILDLVPHVEIMANIFMRRYKVNRDDLISAGYIGLINAYDNFDETFSCTFKTYASKIIFYAMMDEVRRHCRQGFSGERVGMIKAKIKTCSADKVFFCFDTDFSAMDVHQLVLNEKLKLTKRQREMLIDYFIKDRTLEEIGLDANYGTARASQNMIKIIGKLKKFIAFNTKK